MPDIYKPITDLPEAQALGPDDLLCVVQDGEAKKTPAEYFRGERGLPGATGPQGVPGENLKIIGHYNSLADLEAAIPSPEIGASYYIGTSSPYDVYTYLESGWFNAGPLSVDGLETLYLKSFITASESGTIVSIDDGADDVPVKSLVINIEPVQEGSGDPGPDNVRPISGWTIAKLTRCGKNLLKNNGISKEESGVTFTVLEDKSVSLSGTATNNIDFELIGGYKDFSYLAPFAGKSAILTGCPADGSSDTYRIGIRLGQNYAQDKGNGVSFVFRTQQASDLLYVRINIKSGVNCDGLVFRPMIRLADAADSSYEPFTASETEIDLQDMAGTIYGGTLDVATGLLKVSSANIASYNGEAINEPWISSMDQYVPGATPTTGAQVVYPLSDPAYYHLTPQEVNTLLGINNIWADCGPVDVTYRADPTISYKKLKNALLSTGGNV